MNYKVTRNGTEVVDIESCLIGSILIEPMELNFISSQLTQSDFLDEKLGKFFSLLVDRHEAGLPIDDSSLLLESARTIFGDNASLTLFELFQKEPTAVHAKFYAAKIVEASKLRKLERIGSEIISRCHDHAETSESIAAFADSRLGSIACDPSAMQTVTLFEAGVQLLAELKTPSKRRPVITGITRLDELAGGLLPGELEVIAARTGEGKTSIGIQIALRLAQQFRPSLYVSLEMQAQELNARVLCGMTGTQSRYLRRGQFDSEKLDNACRELDGLPLSIFDPPVATLQQIRAVAKLQQQNGLDLLVVDYIGLIKARDSRLPRYEQVGEITAGLKRLAKELSIPVIALCQLNRQADGTLPRLSHLRESGSIEQDADVVLFLHRESLTEYQLIVAKHRHGSTGKVAVTFNPQATKFSDA